MSNLYSFSSITTMMLQTSNIVWQSVSLTDEIKINLEYNIHQGLLNIFVKNIGDDNNKLPCHINVLSDRSEVDELTLNSPELMIFDNEPKICYEISTTYIYDIIHENENLDQIDFNQTIIVSSSSSSSSCFDEQTLDNDDGYSTHSHDDIEQPEQQQHQLSLIIPSPKHLRSFFYSEQYISSLRRSIEQLIWLNPFKKTMQQMMMNHIFV